MGLIGQIKFSGEHSAYDTTCSRSMLSRYTLGLTPLGTSLDQKILQPLLLGPARSNALRKPLLVIAITDGKHIFARGSRAALTMYV